MVVEAERPATRTAGASLMTTSIDADPATVQRAAITTSERQPTTPTLVPAVVPHANRGVPHIVIIGGGFGGLAAAQALRRAAVNITVIDRQNYHLFQPLLYQVAGGVLSPADIASPIRSILSGQRNVGVRLGNVERIEIGRAHV